MSVGLEKHILRTGSEGGLPVKDKTGKLSSAEFDRTVSKFAGSCYLGKPFVSRREGLSIKEHVIKAAEIKKRRRIYTESLRGDIPYCAALAVYRSCLQAAVAGIAPEQAAVNYIFPLNAEEKDIRRYMISATNAAYETGVLFSDITVKRANTDAPEISVSVSGKDIKGNICEKTDPLPNSCGKMSIVMIGNAAAEGTLILRELYAERLKEKYSEQFLDVTELKYKIYPGRAALRLSEKALYMVVPGEGGIFAALWDLSEQLHLGMNIELSKIRVEPLTVEICETLDVSPYEMMGGGAFIAVTEFPEDAVAVCAETGAAASVIGTLNKTNDRGVLNGDEVRYLEPFRSDSFLEKYKIVN